MKQLPIFVEENDKTYTLFIGRNQNDNDVLIRSSQKHDLWFHLDGEISSPHFVLATEGDTIPKRYLNQIASMFREYKNGLSRRYNVIYTSIKNLKLTSIKGTVIPSNVKTIKS